MSNNGSISFGIPEWSERSRMAEFAFHSYKITVQNILTSRAEFLERSVIPSPSFAFQIVLEWIWKSVVSLAQATEALQCIRFI